MDSVPALRTLGVRSGLFFSRVGQIIADAVRHPNSHTFVVDVGDRAFVVDNLDTATIARRATTEDVGRDGHE